MAEYRGLTIKIGADVGEFKAALKSTQSAISATQKSMNELKRAMVLDPGNTNVAAKYIGELQSNAVAASSKMAVLQKQVESLAKTESRASGDKTIGDLAKNTDDAVLKAKRATEAYNNLGSALRQVYKQLSETKTATEKGIDISNPNTSMKTVTSLYKELVKNGERTQKQMNDELAMIERLKSAWKDASAAQKDANDVKTLHDAELEAERLGAAINEAARKMTDMSKSELSERIEESMRNVELLAEDANRARSMFDVLDDAVKLDPTNIELTRERSVALTEAVATATERAAALSDTLQLYKSAGVEQVANKTDHLAQRTEAARQEFENANREVLQLRSNIDGAEARMAELVAQDKKGTKEYQDLEQEVKQLYQDLDVAKTNATALGDAFNLLRDAGDFKDKSVELQTLANNLSRLKQSFREIATEQVNAFGGSRISRVWDDMRDSIEAVNNGISVSENRASSFAEALSFNPADFNALASRAEELQRGLAFADTNADALSDVLSELESRGMANFATGVADANKRLEEAKQRAVDARVAVDELKVELKLAGTEGARPVSEIQTDLKGATAEVRKANYELEKAKELSAYNEVRDQLLDAEIAAKQFEAALKEIARAQVEAADGSDLSKSLERNGALVKALEQDSKMASDSFATLSERLTLDPTNVDVADRRMQSLRDAIVITTDRAGELRDILSKYESAGIDKIAEGIKSASEYSEQMKGEYEESLESIVRISAQLATAKKHAGELRESKSTYGSDWVKTNQDIKLLNEQLVEAKERARDAKAAFDESKDVVAYRETKEQLDQAELAARKFKATLEDVARQKVSDFMEGGDLTKQWTEASEKIRLVSSDVDAAKSRFETLNETAKLDPSNFDKVSETAVALAEAINITEKKAADLRTVLEAYEAAGVDKVANSMVSVSESLKAAEEAAVNAEAEVQKLELELSDAGSEGSRSIDEIRDDLDQAKAAAERTNQELENAKNASGYKEVQSQLESTRLEADRLRSKFNELGDAQANAIEASVKSGLDGSMTELNRLTASLKTAKDNFKNFDDLLKLDPKNIDVATQRLSAMDRVSDRAKMKAEALKKAIAQLKEPRIDSLLDGTHDLTTEFDRAKDKVKETGDALNKFKASMGTASGGTDELESQLKQLEDSFSDAREEYELLAKALQRQNLETDLSSVNKDLAEINKGTKTSSKDLSTSMFMAFQELGQAANQGFDQVVDSTKNLDDALTNVRKTVDASEEGYRNLKESAVELSMVQPIDAATILNAEALGGQLGFAATEVEDLARVATGLDVSTDMGWEEATTNMARFFTIMDTDKSKVENFGATVVGLGNTTATTESEITEMALRIASAGKSLKMPEADVLGLSAALTSMGVKAEAGGSAISTIMTNVDKSVALGTKGIEEYANAFGASVPDFIGYVKQLDDEGLDALAKSFDQDSKSFYNSTVGAYESLNTWAETAGMTTEEFAKKWTSDEGPMDALLAVFKGLDEAVDNEGGNLALMLDELGIKSIRQLDLSRRIANNEEHVAETVANANKYWREKTALSTEVQRRNESLAGQMDILANSVDVVKTEFGEGLTPIVQGGITAMTAFAHLLDWLPNSVKTVGLGLTGVLGAIGSGYPIVHQIGKAFGEFSEALVKSGKAAAMMGTPIGSIVKALGGMLAAIGPVGVAVGALAAVVGGVLVAKYLEARKRQRELNNELSRMGVVSENAKEKSAGLFDSFEDSRPAGMSVEELTDRLREYNDAQEQNETEAQTLYRNLEAYQAVIDELGPSVRGLAEVNDMDAETKAKLSWALEGLNTQLGTNYTLEQLLSGQYEDENGEVQDLISSIDDLIEARERESRAKSDQDRYNNALDMEAEASKNLYDIQREYNAEVERQVELLKEKAAPGMSEEAIRKMAEERVAATELGQAYEAAIQASDAASESLEQAGNNMANDTMLEQAGINVDDFRGRLEEAGISAEVLARISSNEFAAMASSCGGDVDKILDKIRQYNQMDMEGKHPTVDANGNVVDGSAIWRVQEMVAWSNSLYDRHVTYTAEFRTLGDPTFGGYAGGGHYAMAAGGIRYHADGVILNKPTWIGNRDIAGEAGAEAVIPLTNRKYVRPFADTVAEGMMSKIGEVAGDTNYNITVYAEGNSGDEIASAVVGAIRSQNLRSGRVSVKNVRR